MMERKMTRKEAWGEVERLSSRLPGPTEKQLAWVKEHFVSKVAVWQGKSHTAWCSCCGETFNYQPCDVLIEETTCPHCGAKLKMVQSRARTVSGSGYWCIVTVCKGWQVLRFFRVEWSCRLKQKGREQFWIRPQQEIIQKWFKPGQEPVTLSANTSMMPGYYANSYSYGDLHIRKHELSFWMKQWFDADTCPGVRVLPIFKKAGFRGFDKLRQEETFSCFSNPYLEALYKAQPAGEKLSEELREALDHVGKICRFWPSIRIALKHGIDFKKVHIGDYVEYLGNLRFVNKDIRSPRWLVPKDFGQANAEVVRLVTNRNDKARRRRDEENEKRAFEAALKDEKKFLAEKQRYLGLVFEGGGIIIRPLQSITDFRNEANVMHHCVFSNGYYRMPNSLILSARDATGARLETIEVNLNSFQVVQSRGKYNGKTAYHDQILSIMQKAAPAIKRAKYQKVKTA